jgi:hypothetical protein
MGAADDPVAVLSSACSHILKSHDQQGVFMCIGNLSGRLTLFTDAGAVDVEKTSRGRFGADPQAVYQQWDEFAAWAAEAADTGHTRNYSTHGGRG